MDALLDAGITPFATLYHWDLPADLQDRGGWTRLVCGYAGVVFRPLGDRVHHWITLNGAYIAGDKAPGARDLWGALRRCITNCSRTATR